MFILFLGFSDFGFWIFLRSVPLALGPNFGPSVEFWVRLPLSLYWSPCRDRSRHATWHCYKNTPHTIIPYFLILLISAIYLFNINLPPTIYLPILTISSPSFLTYNPSSPFYDYLCISLSFIPCSTHNKKHDLSFIGFLHFVSEFFYCFYYLCSGFMILFCSSTSSRRVSIFLATLL